MAWHDVWPAQRGNRREMSEAERTMRLNVRRNKKRIATERSNARIAEERAERRRARELNRAQIRENAKKLKITRE